MVSIEKPSNFLDWKALPSQAVLKEIGRLAIMTAGIEDLIHAIIWRYLRINDDVGSQVTGRFKLKQLQDSCIKYLTAAGAPVSVVNDLREIFTEVDKSAELRNKCVHWIWGHSYKAVKGMHKLEPPTYQQSKKAVFISARQIQQASDELVWLESRLYPHAVSLDQLYKEIQRHGVDDFPTPWLCIFPQPNRDLK